MDIGEQHPPTLTGTGPVCQSSEVSDVDSRISAANLHKKIEESTHPWGQADPFATYDSHPDWSKVAEVTASAPDLPDVANGHGLLTPWEDKGEDITLELDLLGRPTMLSDGE